MPKIIPVDAFDCVVFGATGDLTLRKLLPALYYRFRDGQIPPESLVIAAARSDLDDDGYRKRASKARHLLFIKIGTNARLYTRNAWLRQAAFLCQFGLRDALKLTR